MHSYLYIYISASVNTHTHRALTENDIHELVLVPKDKHIIGNRGFMKYRIIKIEANHLRHVYPKRFSQLFGQDTFETFFSHLNVNTINSSISFLIHQIDVKSVCLKSNIDSEIHVKKKIRKDLSLKIKIGKNFNGNLKNLY